MKVTKSEIVISAVKPEQYPEGGASGNRIGRKIERRKIVFYQFINQSQKSCENVIKAGKNTNA